METDPFSEVLQLTNAQSVVSGGFTAGGAWAIRFPPMEKITFSALVRGACWLRLHGQKRAVRVRAGDVLLLSTRRSFILSSDLETEPLEAVAVLGGKPSTIVRIGDLDDCLQIGGFIRLDPSCGRLLEDVLPPLIHVRAGSPRATALHWLLNQLVGERVAGLPGATIASSHIAQLMFVHVLRAHLETAKTLPPGWLRAVGDRRIAPALQLMHGDPGRSWRLEQLARAAAMSRTTFALHFKKAAGVGPLAYLAQWRMRLAERALREDNISVATLAQTLGYGSESAFSNAFKRLTGSPPKRYRASARKAPVSPT